MNTFLDRQKYWNRQGAGLARSISRILAAAGFVRGSYGRPVVYRNRPRPTGLVYGWKQGFVVKTGDAGRVRVCWTVPPAVSSASYSPSCPFYEIGAMTDKFVRAEREQAMQRFLCCHGFSCRWSDSGHMEFSRVPA